MQVVGIHIWGAGVGTSRVTRAGVGWTRIELGAGTG